MRQDGISHRRESEAPSHHGGSPRTTKSDMFTRQRCYFPENKMAKLYTDKTAPDPLRREAGSELRTIAKRVIKRHLRLNNEMKTAKSNGVEKYSKRWPKIPLHQL